MGFCNAGIPWLVLPDNYVINGNQSVSFPTIAYMAYDGNFYIPTTGNKDAVYVTLNVRKSSQEK